MIWVNPHGHRVVNEASHHCALALAETITRFNQMVNQGADTDFGRGAGAYDRGIGDPAAPHPNLGTASSHRSSPSRSIAAPSVPAAAR